MHYNGGEEGGEGEEPTHIHCLMDTPQRQTPTI